MDLQPSLKNRNLCEGYARLGWSDLAMAGLNMNLSPSRETWPCIYLFKISSELRTYVSWLYCGDKDRDKCEEVCPREGGAEVDSSSSIRHWVGLPRCRFQDRS